MKFRKVFCIGALCLTMFGNKSFGQETLWEFHPVITVSNPFYGCVAMPFATAYSFMHRHPLVPIVRMAIPTKETISTPKGEAQINTMDWKFKNFAIGYTVGCMPDPEETPLGFQFTINYERQNWEAMLPGYSRYIDFTRQSIAPELNLRLTLGNFYIGFIGEAGGRYNIALKATGEYIDKKTVNEGFTVFYGVGFNLFGCVVSVRFEKDCFDYFNQNYIAPNRLKPYKDFTTKHHCLSINIACYGNI